MEIQDDDGEEMRRTIDNQCAGVDREARNKQANSERPTQLRNLGRNRTKLLGGELVIISCRFAAFIVELCST